MYLKIDESDKRSIYQQVGDGLRAMIARGELREGDALPSVRQVAGDLGVNLNTIAIAYRELQDEGLITIRHGAGAVVASRRSVDKSEDELRTPLRTALTQLVLAGKSKTAILHLVAEELSGLLKGAK